MINMDNVFEKIVAGELPCHKVYENERVLAFLDINPLSKGHLLLIPKRKSVTLDTLPEEDAAAIGVALPRLARALKKVTGCEHYNVLQNNGADSGQVVRHVHFHLIPCDESGKLPFEWPKGELDGEQGASLAKQLQVAAQ